MRPPKIAKLTAFALLISCTTNAAPFPAPPIEQFVLYFGANNNGPTDNSTYIDLAKRSGLAGYGWQSNTLPSNYTHGEMNGIDAATALSNAAPTLPVFVYRHFQMAWRLFDVQRAADDDPTAHGMFLKDNDNTIGSTECRQNIPGGGTSPLYTFVVNQSAGDFWSNQVVGELINESKHAVNAVFFDETDWSACGYNFIKDSCTNISDNYKIKDLRAKLPFIRKTADALTNAGKWPIFSSKNLLSDAWTGLPTTAKRPCLIPHDEYFNALRGADYGRFYEFWMTGNSADLDAATIANVILEGKSGNVGFIARASADKDAQCGVSLCEQGSVGVVKLSYSLAAFMIARTSPYSYFGVSAGWYSPCWCWHSEYDEAAKCGTPIAPAIRTSLYSFFSLHNLI